ncbi:MAG: hypothetical protein KUG74_02605 [Rhodobacteraceae bacterium]|nr:hypothetical protein [Paracoccaceae bacterium]
MSAAKIIFNVVVASIVYLIVSAFMNTGSINLETMSEQIWPNMVIFVVVYGAITFAIAYFRTSKR